MTADEFLHKRATGNTIYFRRDNVAFIGQSPGLTGFLTARENVELGLAIRGVEGLDAHERAVDALVAVGLGELAASSPRVRVGGWQSSGPSLRARR